MKSNTLMWSRRRALLGLGLLMLGRADAARESMGGEPLRIGLTPVFLDNQAAFLSRWRDYLALRIGQPVLFVQRASYQEILDHLLGGGLELAWVCGYSYVTASSQLQLLVAPVYRGESEYHAYLIVRRDRPELDRLDALGGEVFAFSDPNSFSGYLYPRHLLRQAGRHPDRFFRRHFFTWSHRKVVEAVAVGLADGGAVAGYVWESMALRYPEITEQTRVVGRSSGYGFPPVVAIAGLAPERLERLQEVFVGMGSDPQGAGLVAQLNLDGFQVTDSAHYASIAQIAEQLASWERA